MISRRKLIPAIHALQKSCTYIKDPKDTTHFTWVNWRTAYGGQVAVSWGNTGSSFRVYFDFPEHHRPARDDALRVLFSKYAPKHLKAGLIEGHGWTKEEHTFTADRIVGIWEIYQVVKRYGCTSIIYVQESVSARWVFDKLGIPLVPGESGKEWVKGKFIPYATPQGKCI